MLAVSAALGVVTGLASTYPWELGPAVCLPTWALTGLLLGLLVGRTGPALSAGIGYGVFLTLAFLYSRFGGAAHNLPAYTALRRSTASPEPVDAPAGGEVTRFSTPDSAVLPTTCPHTPRSSWR